jgi:O-antigen/teichoic acid export membrane protein
MLTAAPGRATSVSGKVALSSGLNIAQQVSSGVIGIFVARIAGPDVLGILAYAAAFVGLFTALSDFGFGTAHVKRLSEGRDLAQGMGMAWLSKIGSLIVMTGVVLVVFWTTNQEVFSGPEGQAVFYLSLVVLVLTQLSMVPQTTLIAFQDVVRKDLPPAVLQVVNSFARLGLVVLGAGALGLVSADVVTVLVLLGVYLWLLRGLPRAWPSRAIARSYAIFGAPMFVITVLTTVGDRLDRVLLETFSGLTAVGQYAAGMRFGSMLQFLSIAVASMVFPSMARAFAEGRREEAFALCARTEQRLALVAVPIMLGAAALSRPLALVLLGERFADSGPVIAFGTVSMIFQALTQPYRQLLGGADRTTTMVVGHVILFVVQAGCLAAFLAAGGMPLLAIDSGAPAAAAAIALAALIGAGVWRVLAVGALGAHLNARFGIHVASGLGLYAIAYGLSVATGGQLASGCLIALAAIGVHIGILRATGEFGPGEISFLRELLVTPALRIMRR